MSGKFDGPDRVDLRDIRNDVVASIDGLIGFFA